MQSLNPPALMLALLALGLFAFLFASELFHGVSSFLLLTHPTETPEAISNTQSSLLLQDSTALRPDVKSDTVDTGSRPRALRVAFSNMWGGTAEEKG